MSRLNVVVVVSLISVLGCDSSEQARVDPDNLNTVSQTIVNGTRDPLAVALTDSQVMALGWLYPVGMESQPFCTGTLVAPNLVVTASHCVWGGSAGGIGFGVGMDPGDPDGLYVSTRTMSHPDADAALILLGEDVTAGDLDITPIPMNEDALEESLVDQAVQAGGYGETRDSTRDGRWFATVYVDSFNDYEVVVDGRGDQGICYGDSGGPLINLDADGDPVVLAVESWGDESCVDIDHMTRLDTINDWIAPILDGDYPDDPCDGISREGRCVDNVAERCPRGEIQRTDCTELGTVCSYNDTTRRYGCECGDMTEDGWCDGDVAEFCWDDAIRQFNCLQFGMECGYSAGEHQYTCVESASCTGADELGRCEGETAINCADNFTTREICNVDGRVCVVTDDGALCEVIGGADEGEDVGEDVDAGEVTTFPDLGDIADDATGPDEGSTKSNSDDCGCLSTPSNPGTPLAFLTVLAVFVAIRRKNH